MKEKYKGLSFRTDETTFEKLRKLAESQNRSMNNMLNVLIKDATKKVDGHANK